MAEIEIPAVIEFVPIRQAAKEIGRSVSWVYRAIEAGTLPATVRNGPNSVSFIRHELEAAKRRMIERSYSGAYRGAAA